MQLKYITKNVNSQSFFTFFSIIFVVQLYHFTCVMSTFTLEIFVVNKMGLSPLVHFNLLLCLFFLFLLHLLEVNAMYCNLLFHLLVALCSFDNFLLLLRFCLQIFRSNPPVLNPNVFKSSCAISTYVLILPLFINGYPAVPQAGLPNLLSKCTQVGVKLCGSTYVHTPRTVCCIP